MPNFTNTNSMIYNLDKHRYVLTEDAIKDVYGIDLVSFLNSEGDFEPEKAPERFLERISKMLYTYIYSWADDKDISEYRLSFSKFRDGIEEAMEEYAYSILINNRDPSLMFTGNSLHAVEVPPNVQTILLNNGIIFRGSTFNLPKDWKDTKGVDY